MLGSKKRDYTSGDDIVHARLQWHKARMDRLIAKGIEREEASKQAYQEITNGTATKEIKVITKKRIFNRNKGR